MPVLRHSFEAKPQLQVRPRPKHDPETLSKPVECGYDEFMFITQKEVQQWFSTVALQELAGPATYRTEVIARIFMLRGGHRWRPWLFAGVYQTFVGEFTNGEKLVAIAIECFHKASLIHDDIEDDDKPDALHRQVGIPQALNAGDFLIHEGYRLLSESGFSTDLFIDVVCETQLAMCRGQGEELYTGNKRYAELKTGSLFRLAFQLAFRLHRQNKLKAIPDFTDLVGTAYQLFDDCRDGERPRWDYFTLVYEARAEIKHFDPRIQEFLHHYLDTMFGQANPANASSALISTAPINASPAPAVEAAPTAASEAP